MKKLNIIYEDKELIVVDKPYGLLTVATPRGETNTLYSAVREYVKKKNPHNKIFIVHRLDKDTSGVVIFAKNEKIKHLLQDSWNSLCKVREYIAVVEGTMPKKKEKLVNYLKEDKTLHTFVTNDSKNGKLAITNYEVINTNNKYSLLKISIETGRKNQIRCQLAHIGNPIVGDKKYNAKSNPLKRLGLHHRKIVLIHPVKKCEYTFEANIPKTIKI